jgi:hypothetical protein
VDFSWTGIFDMRQRKAIAADEDAATNSRVAKSSINRCTFIPS